MHAHNPDTTWGVFVSQNDSEEGTLEGYYAFLLLNEAGHKALIARSLDRKNPAPEFLATPGSRPAAAHMWTVIAKGLSAQATMPIIKTLGKTCAGIPLYATAGTNAGLAILRRRGFKPVAPDTGELGSLFLFHKPTIERTRGAAISARSLVPPAVHPASSRPALAEPRITIDVARTSDDVEKALAIRAAVYMMEQHCPYEEEFDGNDRTCTHLVGHIGGAPAATIRIRYFAGFVKLERLAVLPHFRGTAIARQTIQTAIDFVRRKGYRKMYGHSQKRLLGFWAQYGFKPMDKQVPLVFSDHEYVEVACDLEPHQDALSMHSDPYVILRPEGLWDQPGILERSAERPPTNPH
ncbi:MAG TPA: GNAT family N-acetyltransferase [Rhizomicrobium sp.]|nr:GNAT family N-acetyltransferase [Rhizomicrobium sp.]